MDANTYAYIKKRQDANLPVEPSQREVAAAGRHSLLREIVTAWGRMVHTDGGILGTEQADNGSYEDAVEWVIPTAGDVEIRLLDHIGTNIERDTPYWSEDWNSDEGACYHWNFGRTEIFYFPKSGEIHWQD